MTGRSYEKRGWIESDTAKRSAEDECLRQAKEDYLKLRADDVYNYTNLFEQNKQSKDQETFYKDQETLYKLWESGQCAPDPATTHLKKLGIYTDCLEQMVNRDGNVKLLFLQARTIDDVWDRCVNIHEPMITACLDFVR
jgi:hypothetical protein